MEDKDRERATRLEKPWQGVPAQPSGRQGRAHGRLKFATTWWGARWLNALASWADPMRLSRGRTYARAGRVLDMHIDVGFIYAQVQGSRPRPYHVRIEIKTFSDAEWERIIEAMAAQALYAAQLLNGEMPLDIETVFEAAGVHLFPSSEDDFYSDCSCPDWDPFCKHRAAVCYLVGERLDDDPFLLFLLRGRTKDQVLAALRAARAKRAGLPSEGQGVNPGEIPSDISPEAFWRLGPEADDLEIHVRSPQIEMEVIKLLGDLTFAEDAARLEELAAIYRHVSRCALRLAFDESDVEG